MNITVMESLVTDGTYMVIPDIESDTQCTLTLEIRKSKSRDGVDVIVIKFQMFQSSQ